MLYAYLAFVYKDVPLPMTHTIQRLAVRSLALFLCAGAVSAQQTNPPPPGGSWNPYLVQGFVSPAPMLPAECNGTGNLIFDVGNTGSSDIVWVTNQPMLLTISLSYGVPNVVNPNDTAQAITAVTGPGAAWFNWEYFPAQKTFRGTQKATIPGDARRTISIAYKVTQNSFINTSYQNGYNCNISPPGYTNPQPTDDDTVAAYTYVEAFDYSDAPLAYTAVSHVLNVAKNVDGKYTHYLYLGAAVDPETSSQASPVANGDDTNQTGGLNANDDDGVVFPTMTPGTSVTIPVTVILWDWDPDNSQVVAQLVGWIDWNKNNSFTNTGERIINIDVSSYLVDEGVTAWTGARTFVIPFTVAVPANASGTYQARFRFGPAVSSTFAVAGHGEVEDYTFFAGTTSGTVTGRIYHDVNGNSARDATEPFLPNISVTVTGGNNSTQNLVTDANGYWSALVQPGNATVDINNADPDLPTGTALTQGTDPRSVTILSQQNIDGGTAGFGPAGYPNWQSQNNTGDTMDQDHDQDGVANGIEYFLVGPQGNSTGLTTLPAIQQQGGVMSITWTKASTYTGTYASHFVVETSTNLQTPWTPVPLGPNVTINGNQLTYTFPQPYLSRQFVHLRVSGP